nr:carboxypeptidase D-like [Penaeus vannamei]
MLFIERAADQFYIYFYVQESSYDNRVRVVVLGGLYGAQPVGRELVIRLARHLGAGWAKKDVKIQTLLENTRIFLVPAIDIDGFDAAIPGMCGYSKVSEMQNEVGGSFSPEISNTYAQATISMLEQIKHMFSVTRSLERKFYAVIRIVHKQHLAQTRAKSMPDNLSPPSHTILKLKVKANF